MCVCVDVTYDVTIDTGESCSSSGRCERGRLEVVVVVVVVVVVGLVVVVVVVVVVDVSEAYSIKVTSSEARQAGGVWIIVGTRCLE